MHTLCPYGLSPDTKSQGYDMVSKQVQEASVFPHGMMNIAIHYYKIRYPVVKVLKTGGR